MDTPFHLNTSRHVHHAASSAETSRRGREIKSVAQTRLGQPSRNHKYTAGIELPAPARKRCVSSQVGPAKVQTFAGRISDPYQRQQSGTAFPPPGKARSRSING